MRTNHISVFGWHRLERFVCDLEIEDDSNGKGPGLLSLFSFRTFDQSQLYLRRLQNPSQNENAGPLAQRFKNLTMATEGRWTKGKTLLSVGPALLCGRHV